MNNLPKVVTQQRRGRASNPRLLDHKSDALPLSHRDWYVCGHFLQIATPPSFSLISTKLGTHDLCANAQKNRGTRFLKF